MSQWKVVDDAKVMHLWICKETGEKVYVSPDFYAQNGTPVSSETGDDMEYIHTEIWTGRKSRSRLADPAR